MYVNYVKIYQKGLTTENLDALDPGDSDQAAGVGTMVADNRAPIGFDGLNVTSSTPGLAIYSLSGSRLMATDNGVLRVDSLSPGVYLAHNSRHTRKICIR